MANDTTLAPGAGTIDGHDEDDDLQSLVAGFDGYLAGILPERGLRDLTAIYRRREPLLVRTAEMVLGADRPPSGQWMDPKMARIAASWLLSN